MKKLLLLSLSLFIMSAFTFFAPKKIIFFGDSITQAGIGPKGYITMMKQMIEKNGETEKFNLIGAGIGGNKVYDLYLRLEDSVLVKKPDQVFVYVGVNDVWHKKTYATGTDPDKFERFYQAIITKLKANNIQTVLVTPACIGEKTDFSNESDGDLNQYSKIIKNLAAKNGLQVCDLRQKFLDYNLKNNSENHEKGILTSDRVHLNEAGNQLVAEAMMEFVK